MKLSRWNMERHGPLTEAGVRTRYREALHRIFRREIPEAASFAGSAEERLLIVLSGRCTLTWGSHTQQLAEGDMLEVPSGPFRFRCDGPVRFMAIYRLPAELWPN